MPIRNQSGRLPFSDGPRAAHHFRAARLRFAVMAAKMALAAFRDKAPVDTGELRSTITARVQGEIAILEIPDRLIHAGEVNARRLALVLEIGLSKKGKPLMRSRGGGSTEGWMTEATAEVRAALGPVGEQLVIQAAYSALNEMIHG